MAGVLLKEEQITSIIDALYKAFELEPFTLKDAAEKIGVSKPVVLYALQRSKDRVKLLATFTEVAEWHVFKNGNKGAFNWYTFDLQLNKLEFLNRFDPIPLSKRTLKSQLFGEYAVRLREVKDYIWKNKLPPYPTDRPLDYWESGVFKWRNNQPLQAGDL